MNQDIAVTAMPKRNYYVWIDWLRNLSMAMIVWGHFFPYAFTSFVYSFNVPVFFFLSGMLARRESSWGAFLKKNLRTLIIPYVIICLVKAVAYIFKHLDGGAFDSVIGIVCGFHTYNGAPGAKLLWFVYTLFILKLLLQSKALSLGHIANAIVAVLSAVAAYFYASSAMADMQWAIGNAFLALPFFVAGIEYEKTMKLDGLFSGNKIVCLCASLLLLILVYFASSWNGTAYMYEGSYGSNIFLFYGIAFAAILAFMLISMSLGEYNFKANRILAIGGLLVLGFQYDFIHPFRKLIAVFASQESLLHPLITFVASFVILMLFIPITYLVEKYIPILVGKRKIR